MGSHSAGEAFLLLDLRSLERIDVSAAQIGATISATPRGIADLATPSVNLVVGGEAMRPPSPVHLRARVDAAGELRCTWCRRSRLGWAWVDGVDAALGAASEHYRLRLEGTVSAFEAEIGLPEASFTAAELAILGAGTITVSVVQVGDLAVSRPATLSIS